MIRQIIYLLTIYLIGTPQQTQRSLYKQPEYKILNLNNPGQLIILSAIAMIIFTIIIFMFMPGTESGLWYNQPHY